MKGQTCLITGATAGIGRETALGLVRMGASVLIVARDRQRGEAVRDEVAAVGDAPVELLLCDLQSQAAIRDLAAEVIDRFPRLDVLINNAGLTLGEHQVSAEGIEMTLAVNHLAPFLLTNLLRDHLVASAPSRVVTVASQAHHKTRMDFDDLEGKVRYSGWNAYCQSKLANILFTRELASRLAGTGVTANCLHPGVVASSFGRGDAPLMIRLFFSLARWFLISSAKGAETSIYLASSKDVEKTTGAYFGRKMLIRSSVAANDREAGKRLWKISERMTNLTSPQAPR